MARELMCFGDYDLGTLEGARGALAVCREDLSSEDFCTSDEHAFHRSVQALEALVKAHEATIYWKLEATPYQDHDPGEHQLRSLGGRGNAVV